MDDIRKLIAGLVKAILARPLEERARWLDRSLYQEGTLQDEIDGILEEQYPEEVWGEISAEQGRQRAERMAPRLARTKERRSAASKRAWSKRKERADD